MNTSIFDGGALVLLILSAWYLGFWVGRAHSPVWGFDVLSGDDAQSYVVRHAPAGEAWRLMKEGGEGRVSVYQGRFRMGRFLMVFAVFFFFCHPVMFPGGYVFRLVPVLLSAFSMAYIVSFSQYFLTLLIGGGQVKTFTIVMVPYLQGGDRNIACVYSVIFLGITLVLFGIFEWTAGKVSKNNSTEFYS